MMVWSLFLFVREHSRSNLRVWKVLFQPPSTSCCSLPPAAHRDARIRGHAGALHNKGSVHGRMAGFQARPRALVLSRPVDFGGARPLPSPSLRQAHLYPREGRWLGPFPRMDTQLAIFMPIP